MPTDLPTAYAVGYFLPLLRSLLEQFLRHRLGDRKPLLQRT